MGLGVPERSRTTPRHRLAVIGVAAFWLLTGCVTQPRPRFVEAQQAGAQPAGFPEVRFDADGDDRTISFRSHFDSDGLAKKSSGLKVLALSGGGAHGAYGAGLLVGWTASGSRPEFSLVTGVSTGALLAPFAFLGPKWDHRMEVAFTDGRAAGLLWRRGAGALLSAGLYRPEPLRRLVESYVDDELIGEVAKQHSRGRRLLVGTTDLDTQKSVIWDLGAIATRGGPTARSLFIDVLVASASVPGVFPPAYISVTDNNGITFREMHMDGGINMPFFSLPESLIPLDQGSGVEIDVLLNYPTQSGFNVTSANPLAVAARAFSTMQKAATRASMSATATLCLRPNVTCRFTDVPEAVRDKSFLDFSTPTMVELFRIGREGGVSGQAWRRMGSGETPPRL
jgi:hypothetical protein